MTAVGEQTGPLEVQLRSSVRCPDWQQTEDRLREAVGLVGLSCRVLRAPQGLQGAPTVDQLVGVLR